MYMDLACTTRDRKEAIRRQPDSEWGKFSRVGRSSMSRIEDRSDEVSLRAGSLSREASSDSESSGFRSRGGRPPGQTHVVDTPA